MIKMKNIRFKIDWISPAWLVFMSFFLFLALIGLMNHRRFSFTGINFFTLLWISSVLIIAHGLANAGKFRECLKNGRWKDVTASFSAVLSSYLPYLLVALLYDNVSLFHASVTPAFDDMDYRLLRIDEFIFGVQPTIFLERYLYPFMAEYFMFAYTLFVLPYLFLVYIYQKGDRPVFDRLLLSQIICSVIALTCFIYLPARGPRHVFDPGRGGLYADLPRYERSVEGVRIESLHGATGIESLYRFQYDAWNVLERVKTDCMPSMHTALYFLCLLYVVRYRGMFRWKRFALSFWSISCASLMFSCVYLRYHWAIDIIAGMVLAFLAFIAADRVIAYWDVLKAEGPGLSEPVSREIQRQA